MVVEACIERSHFALSRLTGSLVMFMFQTLLAGKTVQADPGTGAAVAAGVEGARAATESAVNEARTAIQRERLMVMAIGIRRRYG